MMGVARVTSIFASSLSSVTVRGAEIVLASASLFRNDRTAFTPSAFRKPVAGDKPLTVLKPRPPPPIIESRTVAVVEPGVAPLGLPLGNGGGGVPGMVVVLLPDITPFPKLKL